MKHRMTLAVAVVAMCLGPALAARPTYAGTDAATTTSFALKASGYGTRIKGGEIPAGSSTTPYALRVELLATGTSVRVARSHAALYSGVTGGVFGGRAPATRVVTAAGDIVESGPNPLTPMPCQGTYGKLREKSLALVDLGGQLVVKGASSTGSSARPLWCATATRSSGPPGARVWPASPSAVRSRSSRRAVCSRSRAWSSWSARWSRGPGTESA